MTKKIDKVIVAIIYAIPYVFISLYLDSEYHTVAGYVLLSVVMISLCTYCIKQHNAKLLVVGNILSIASSFICLQISDLVDKNYFKPFSAGWLMVLIAVISLLIQLFAYFICTFRGKTKLLFYVPPILFAIIHISLWIMGHRLLSVNQMIWWCLAAISGFLLSKGKHWGSVFGVVAAIWIMCVGIIRVGADSGLGILVFGIGLILAVYYGGCGLMCKG